MIWCYGLYLNDKFRGSWGRALIALHWRWCGFFRGKLWLLGETCCYRKWAPQVVSRSSFSVRYMAAVVVRTNCSAGVVQFVSQDSMFNELLPERFSPGQVPRGMVASSGSKVKIQEDPAKSPKHDRFGPYPKHFHLHLQLQFTFTCYMLHVTCYEYLYIHSFKCCILRFYILQFAFLQFDIKHLHQMSHSILLLYSHHQLLLSF